MPKLNMIIGTNRRASMPPLYSKQATDLQTINDEDHSLNFQGQEKSILTQEDMSSKNGEKKVNLDEAVDNHGKECPRWCYGTIILILTAYLIVEYIAQVQANHRNTYKFINNVKILKQMKVKEGGGVGSFEGFQETRQQQRESSGRSSSVEQKINLRFNQAKVQNQQHSLLDQSGTDSSAKRVNDNYAPALPPASNDAIQPRSIAHQDRNPDVYQAPEPSLHTISGNTDNGQTISNPKFVIPQTSKVYSSINQPSPPQPQVQLTNITPIIQPMNKIKTAGNPDGIYGVFAGVTTQQLVQARQYKKIIDGDVFAESESSKKEREYYQSKYNIHKYKELPFCIVLPTFNNADGGRYLKNIKSIAMQDYNNYHVVIIDDASSDQTGELIKTYLQGQTKLKESQYILIRNDKQMRAMNNLRLAAKNHCKPEEIFLIVDGDDELLGKQVLKLYNSVFQQRKLWFIYSNFLTNTGSIGFSRAFPASTIKDNTYRSYPFVTSHLRAFYTKLFLNIKEEDLKDDAGEYLKAANDVAICIPILEQSHERVGYLPEITYYYNSNTGINNHQLRLSQQRNNDRRTRSHAPYNRLQNLLD